MRGCVSVLSGFGEEQIVGCFHMVLNFSVPLNAVSSLINRGIASFARRTLLNGVSYLTGWLVGWLFG